MTVASDTTRAEIAEHLVEACRQAKREYPVVGSAEWPTGWDDCHAFIDELLGWWERAE